MDKAYIAAFKVARDALKAELDEIDARIQALHAKHSEFHDYEKQCYEEKLRALDSLFVALIKTESAKRAAVARDIMELAGQKFTGGNGSDQPSTAPGQG